MSRQKRLLRKLISVALCATMLCSTSAFAEVVGFADSSISGVTVNAAGTESPASSFSYDIKNNEVTITGFKGSETDVVIPAEIEGKPVTSIEWGAFYYCTGLTSITIPDSVTSIGECAFYYCTGLTSVTIGDGVKSIGSSAFEGCTGLTSINVSSKNDNYYSENGVLFNKEKTELIKYPERKTGEYKIPDSVTSIGNSAFLGCTGLTSITIPDSVTSIADSAFSSCTGLTSITIPDSVTSIGWSAFEGCTGLTSITIPDSVTEIEQYAFENCTGLTSITIPDSVTSIGWSAFEGCTGLTSITIPDSVTSIGGYAFRDCTGLTSINVSSKNDNYSSENGVLFNKEKTRLIKYPERKTGEYKIPDSVTSIGWSAFEGCTGLTNITIPDSVTSIGNAAFYYCTRLTNITIPNSVTSIADSAFSSCTGLTSITIPDSVSYIGNDAFYGCENLTIYGKKGSYAKKYANNNNIKFVDSSILRNVSTINTTATVGEPITLNAIAESGTGPYTYALMYKKSTSDTWVKIGTKYGTQSTGSFTPKSAVKYDIMINVKDSTGKVKSKTFTVDVKAPLKNKTTVNAENVKVGEKIVLKGAASGGTSGYKYAFYYKKSKNSTWVEMKPAYTTKSAAFKPGTATSYDVKSVVKDAAGNTTEKVFTVNVTK